MLITAVHKILMCVILCLSLTIAGAQEHSCYIHDEKAHPRERQLDMERMIIDVYFVPEKREVNGTVTHYFTPLRKQVDSIFLDAPGITINSALLDGKNVDFETNKEGVVIKPAKPLTWNTHHELKLEYLCYPMKGIYFIGWNDTTNRSRKQIWTQGQGIDNRYWVPSFDDMGDKVISETIVTFDEEYEVLSNGKLEKAKTNKNGTKTWHYKMEHPHAPYLVMIAVGNYEVSTSKSKSGVTINNWYYPDQPERVEPTYRYTTEMMDWMEQEFGVKYPWHAYSQVPVQDFIYGAMENTTATIFGDFYYIDERQFLDRYYIGTNAHELTHQWFGDYITARSPEHTWLQETFATHYQKHFERHIFGEDHFQWNRRTELWRTLSAGKQDDKPIMHSEAGSARIYPKGSLVIDMLKYVIGEEQYNKAQTYYLKKHAYGSVETHDFVLAFYETLGLDLEWFFNQWIYHGGEPHYLVTYNEVPPGNEPAYTQVIVKQVHEIKEVVGLFNMPIVIEVHYTDGTSNTIKPWINEATQIIQVPNPENKEIAYVLFDPNSQIIKNITFEKGFEELKAQALQAEHMIDRYDAVVGMRSISLDTKREALVDIFKKEPFWAVRREVAKQLANNHSKLERDFYLSMVNDPHQDVRHAVVEEITHIPQGYLQAFQDLLRDSSYNVVAATLVKLADQYPESAKKFLALTEGLEGRGNHVKIAWLSVAATHEPDKYLPVLADMAGPGFEFMTRQNAFAALSKFNYLNEVALANMLDAAFSPNRRLGRDAIKHLKSYMGQTNYQQMIDAHYKQGTWDSWQEQVWGNIR